MRHRCNFLPLAPPATASVVPLITPLFGMQPQAVSEANVLNPSTADLQDHPKTFSQPFSMMHC